MKKRRMFVAWLLGISCLTGAEQPQVGAPTGQRSEHWAFRPLNRPSVPDVRRIERAHTALDRFIEAELERNGLTLGSEADRATLIRRVCFDLTGLPPTLAELTAYLSDRRPDAYERLIERCLASPHYGERWGKYWLDAAGYADSNGYFNADSDRPLAYHYRDYVIRSFNTDKPYDRFVFEQLAGDELIGYKPGSEVSTEMIDPLTATHFLRNAPDGTGESDGNPDEQRLDRFTVLEGNLQNVMSCLLGITIQCARCHSHKFEPIAQQEYYRLQAIFFPAYCPERWVKPKDRDVIVASRAQREEHHRRQEQIDRQVKAWRADLIAQADPLRERLLRERLQHLDPARRDAVLAAARVPQEKRSKEQQGLTRQNAELLKIDDGEVRKRFPEYAEREQRTRQAIAAREKERPPPLEKLAVLVETDANPPVHHLLRRGVHSAPGREVQPGVPAALCTSSNVYRLEPRQPGRISTGRRSAFARWVTSPQNPLFARVFVNRVWQHHFGTGIVTTPDNLGQSGGKPTHPHLLDYLASEFIRSGWSIKSLHRSILRSAVYRQSGELRADAFQTDPDNRLLWRFPPRRLDAEALRDAMLAVSGELDARAGGPYVPATRQADGGIVVDERHPDAHRRAVYLRQRRSEVVTFLALFDAPAMTTTCGVRPVSTVPLQSLALLNADFTRQRANAFARRLESEAGAVQEKRILLAFQLSFGRPPDAEEYAAAERFLAAQKEQMAHEKDVERRLWSDFCQMLLASNSFLYVD